MLNKLHMNMNAMDMMCKWAIWVNRQPRSCLAVNVEMKTPTPTMTGAAAAAAVK